MPVDNLRLPEWVSDPGSFVFPSPAQQCVLSCIRRQGRDPTSGEGITNYLKLCRCDVLTSIDVAAEDIYKN